LAKIELQPSANAYWESVMEAIIHNHSFQNKKKELFLDISELVQRDAKSGIQRVVRSILNQLLANPPEGFRVEPVYTNHDGLYRYARNFTCNFLNLPTVLLSDDFIKPGQGDVFLGLDFCPQYVPLSSPAFSEMRGCGTAIFFVVYDLLCVKRPEFFIEGTVEGFNRWLRVVAQYADGAICISKTVADELALWLQESGQKDRGNFKVAWFHLGGDIENSLPSEDVPNDFGDTLERILMHPSVLMVGTIEPRKGHEQAISAFEILWEKGVKVNLIVVGKPGWLVENLIKRMRNHSLSGRHLFWFDAASDLVLQKLYQSVDGCLLASEAEGFGLPLVEAARHKKPILTRDIPVFREIAGEHATYFSGTSATDLAMALKTWVGLLTTNTAIESTKMECLTWAMSSANLINVVLKLLKLNSENSETSNIQVLHWGRH
jgi:glycosyltransferase involved in cell wall biosynthesis